MGKMKATPGGRSKPKTEVSLVRSSAAEYLTLVAASGQGGVEAVYADENVWLSQKMMGVLYAVETHTINYHLKKVFEDGELQAGSVIRNFRITAADGKGDEDPGKVTTEIAQTSTRYRNYVPFWA
jgi:hypothetical protein